MATMLNVFDRQTRKKAAVLENAYSITETHELNQIYSLSFVLPADDPKTQYCLPRNYVRYGDTGELYRIKTPKVSEGNIRTVTYECEHVITTLCDNVMFGSFTYGGAGVRTAEVITWLLGQQKEENWVLGTCEFDRKFEYNWEQENLLNALYSIPREFAEAYKWTFDTVRYPWTISLVKIDTTAKPEYYLRAKSNILSSGTSADYANICTRIYPLGYGEGVNQLNIRSVNNDVPYLQSPKAITDQYGIVEKVLVDRRFENAETLMAYAQSMLDLYQTPSMSRTFDVTDIYPLTSQSWDDAQVGKICKMTGDGTTAYITRTRRQWDKAGDLQIDLSTKASGIAQNVADLADRIRIESVYAQGATQLYQHSKDANATPDKGMIISLYFPSEMKQINKILMRLKLNKFRSYSQTTDNNGGYDTTLRISQGSQNTNTQTNTGNATVKVVSGKKIITVGMTAGKNQDLTTTSAGGQQSETDSYNATLTGSVTSEAIWKNDDSNVDTASGTFGVNVYSNGYDVEESPYDQYVLTEAPNGGDTGPSHIHSLWSVLRHTHNNFYGRTNDITLSFRKSQISHTHKIDLDGVGSHNHKFSIPAHKHKLNISHTHDVEIPENTLEVPCPSHKHSIVIPGHTHTINIPAHHHGIQSGIFESTETPTAFDIYVGNEKKDTIEGTSFDGDITQWLLNNKNQIPRNSWLDVEIRPNAMAYVISSVFVQGFVQSRGGGNY